VQQLSHEISGIERDVREYALVRLLEGIHADGLIEIYRTAAEASDDEHGAVTMQEHKESAPSGR
jgi:hypothetical protein